MSYGMDGWCKEIPTEETHDKRTETHACDCISRQAAVDAVCEMVKECFGADEEEQTAIAVTIRNLPSAQPERKKGRWHQRFYSKVEMMVCSECGNEFSYDAETGLRDYNFCPNCGADMREDEQE